jgi:hypothetical protein
MEFKWQHAKDLFAKLTTPDYGATQSWISWYEIAWGHLSNAGLTKVETPLDLTRIKLRIAATCWLSLDFVAAMQANEYCNTFYWSDWISELGIDPTWAMATALDDQGMREVIATQMDDPGMEHEECDDEGIIFFEENGDDIVEKTGVTVIAAAVTMQRDLVCDALINQLDGSHMLFLCLYTACMDIDRLTHKRKDEIEDEIDELQYDLDALSIATEEVRDLPEHHKRIESLRTEIERLEGCLDDSSIRETVMEQLLVDAFSGSPIGWEDENDIERMRAFEWCHTGCAIINLGEG